MKKSNNPRRKNRRIVVPAQLQLKILNEFHDNPLSGHLGRNKTLNRVIDKFFWFNMREQVEIYVAACIKCQTRKRHVKTRQRLKHAETSRPFEMLGIDVAGPFTITKKGNKYIITAICYFSKYCITAAVKDFTAFTTAKFIFEQIICKFGIVAKILTDQGANFEAELTQHLCQFLKIDKLRCTSYHPKAAGEVERFNKTLKSMLSCYVNENHSDWDLFLQQVTFAYNTAVQESTRLSPFRIVYGREENGLGNLVNEANRNLTPNSYVDLLIKNQERTNRLVKQNIQKSHQVQDAHYKVKNPFAYKVNEKVLVTNEVTKVGLTKKFTDKYRGPYTILAIRDDTYTVKETSTGKVLNIHYDRLIPYNDPMQPTTKQTRNSNNVAEKNSTYSSGTISATEPSSNSAKNAGYNLRQRKIKPSHFIPHGGRDVTVCK